MLNGNGKGNSTLSSVIQEDQLDDGWSPVIFDYDRVTNPKALREAFSIRKFPTSLIKTTRDQRPTVTTPPRFRLDRCKAILASRVVAMPVPATLVTGPFPSKLVPI